MRTGEPLELLQHRVDVALQGLTLYEHDPVQAVKSARRAIKASKAVIGLYEDSTFLQAEREALRIIHRKLAPVRERHVATMLASSLASASPTPARVPAGPIGAAQLIGGTAPHGTSPEGTSSSGPAPNGARPDEARPDGARPNGACGRVAPLPLAPSVRTRIEAAKVDLLGFRLRFDSWPDAPSEDELRARLGATYRKARVRWGRAADALRIGESDVDESLHDCRLAVGRLRLQLWATAKPLPKETRRRLTELDRLLGLQHDLTLNGSSLDDEHELLVRISDTAREVLGPPPREFRESLEFSTVSGS